MTVPDPTPILRLIHIDNLALCLARGGLHAPNHQPGDSLEYRAIHSLAVQASRHDRGFPVVQVGRCTIMCPSTLARCHR